MPRLLQGNLVINMLKRVSAFLLALLMALALASCGGQEAGPAPSVPAVLPPSAASQEPSQAPESRPPAETERAEPSQAPASLAPAVSEEGWYSSKEEVALYIHLYGHLPGNYVTKREAQEAGWSGGSVERCMGEGAAIGGGRFGNYEGLLPEKEGRVYTECDIDTVGTSSRGAKRIVFSNDGLIYYTEDHYESFELLYGEP